MKKFYSLAAFAFIGLMAYSAKTEAQGITLQSADMPSVGLFVENAFDTLTSSVSKLTPGNAGASQTWSYGFVPISYTQVDSFVTPSTTPYAASYPSATVADTAFGTAGYNYFNNTGTAFTVVGSVQNIQGYLVPIVFNPPFLQMNLPANYGNNSGGKSRANVPPQAFTYTGIDSVKGSLTLTYADTMDAYGSLTSPYGTKNVLRQKHYELDIDSIFVHSTVAKAWVFYQAQITKTHQYRWYANGIGDAFAIMTMDSTNTTPKSFQWYNGNPTGINEVSQVHHALVYPNPCGNMVNFRFSTHNALYVSVFDITGRQIGKTAMNNGTAIVNTSLFANGMYLYRITDKSGNVLDNGKFSVQQ